MRKLIIAVGKCVDCGGSKAEHRKYHCDRCWERALSNKLEADGVEQIERN